MFDIPVDSMIFFLRDPTFLKYGIFVISPEEFCRVLTLTFLIDQYSLNQKDWK